MTVEDCNLTAEVSEIFKDKKKSLLVNQFFSLGVCVGGGGGAICSITYLICCICIPVTQIIGIII